MFMWSSGPLPSPQRPNGEELNLDYDSKRDRWNGFQPDDYKQVIEVPSSFQGIKWVYTSLQKVGIWIREVLCWFSFFSRFWGWRMVIFQPSGFYCIGIPNKGSIGAGHRIFVGFFACYFFSSLIFLLLLLPWCAGLGSLSASGKPLFLAGFLRVPWRLMQREPSNNRCRGVQLEFQGTLDAFF